MLSSNHRTVTSPQNHPTRTIPENHSTQNEAWPQKREGPPRQTWGVRAAPVSGERGFGGPALTCPPARAPGGCHCWDSAEKGLEERRASAALLARASLPPLRRSGAPAAGLQQMRTRFMAGGLATEAGHTCPGESRVSSELALVAGSASAGDQGAVGQCGLGPGRPGPRGPSQRGPAGAPRRVTGPGRGLGGRLDRARRTACVLSSLSFYSWFPKQRAKSCCDTGELGLAPRLG